MNKNTIKSIGAVIAGFVTVAVLSTVTDVILEKVGFFPSDRVLSSGLLLVALIYRCVYTILGGYVTAKLAPYNPMKHVIILSIIGVIGGTIGVIVGWNLSAHWYPIAIALTAFPLTYFGGTLKK